MPKQQKKKTHTHTHTHTQKKNQTKTKKQKTKQNKKILEKTMVQHFKAIRPWRKMVINKVKFMIST